MKHQILIIFISIVLLACNQISNNTREETLNINDSIVDLTLIRENTLIKDSVINFFSVRNFKLITVQELYDSNKFGFYFGEKLLHPTYNYISEISKNGFALAQNKNGKANILDFNKKSVTKTNYSMVVSPGDYGTYCGKFNEGFAPVSLFLNDIHKEEAIEKYGFIDRNGKLIIECNYEYVKDFSYGYVRVENDEGVFLIDTNGSSINETKYEDIIGINEGIAWVKKNKKWGAINNKGDLVINYMYYDVYSFSDSLAFVSESNNEEDGLKVIDINNTIILKGPYWMSPMGEGFWEGESEVYDTDDRCIIINKKGEVLKEGNCSEGC
jgi:hypothetical protein